MLSIHVIETWEMRMPEEVGLEERLEVGQSLTRDEVENVEIPERGIDATEKVSGEAGLLCCIVDENGQRSPEGSPSATWGLYFGSGGGGCGSR